MNVFQCAWKEWAERYFQAYHPDWEVSYDRSRKQWRQNWYDIIKQGGKCRMPSVQNVEEKS